MPTLDLPLDIVTQMLDQANNGEQLLGILNAVVGPDPVDVADPVVDEQDEDDEPTDTQLEEIVPEVIDTLIEVFNFDVNDLEKELSDWDSIPDDGFVTV
jgi:hypothetical protein